MSVSAIVPTYNRARMLRECLESLANQTHEISQIIVVNDGSEDDTDEVVREFDPTIILLNKPNGGKSSALNYGLAHCDAEYVWICDDDDVAAPDGLARMVEALEADPQAGFVFGTFQTFRDEEGRRIYEPAPKPVGRPDEARIELRLLESMYTLQFAMLVRRSLYEIVGPFREDMIRSQDYEMTLRLAHAGRAIQLPDVIFYQRVHSGTRGTKGESFSIEQNYRKWLTYDQKIFTAVRRDYQVGDFLPSFAEAYDESRKIRAALIERACLMAMRSLWGEAANDIKAATEGASLALAEEERFAIRHLAIPELAWDDLSEKDVYIQKIREASRASPVGFQIVFELFHPVLWLVRKKVRTGEISRAMRLLRMLRKVLGFSGIAAKAAQAIRR